MKNNTLRIFLDSRDWIILTRVRTGKENDPLLKKIHDKIQKMSDSGNAIFPISMFHLEDIMKRTDKISREHVIDIMIDISKGWAMKPFLLYFKKEIENAALNRLGINSMHNISSEIIGNGIAYTAGEEYYVTSKNPEIQKFLDEKEDELRAHVNSIESMKLILKSDSFAKYFYKWTSEYEKLAIKLEDNRIHKRTMTKIERYNYELAAYLTGRITPHLGQFLWEKKIPPERVVPTTKSDIESFLENMPAVNVFFRLILARDEESPERKIKSNDMIDINHLAGSIPYCDIVVVEKMFANLSKKQKLDKKYNCIVCSSLQEFYKIISQ
ncbi:MAG: hypothetical protein OER78_03890 [Nitrosopumilus sp.]|nr:hypothetical protein [Nitrosopumilus sp.]